MTFNQTVPGNSTTSSYDSAGKLDLVPDKAVKRLMSFQGSQKLIVGALRTLQTSFQNFEHYEHTTINRVGRPKKVIYRYSGRVSQSIAFFS